MVSHNNALIGSAYMFMAVFIGNAIYTLMPYPMQFLFNIDTTVWTSTWSSANYAANMTMVTNTFTMAGTATPILILGAVVAMGLVLAWLVASAKGRLSE